ncbi:hypothetical protein LTR85_006768 [Meristemomyces frigidus]|nr:hypothetical protein LTR85_006768 [Meristemomyces frigidus]
MKPTLCELPPELRNRINEMVLIQEEPFLITDDVITATQPPVSLVCKLLREEALSIFYSSNQFIVIISQQDISAVQGWLRAIGSKNARHIRKLEVRFYAASSSARSVRTIV